MISRVYEGPTYGNCAVCGAMLIGPKCLSCDTPTPNWKPEAQGDVIERMMREYELKRGNHPNIHEQHRVGMTAALRVALDEALGPVTGVEWHSCGGDHAMLRYHDDYCTDVPIMSVEAVSALLNFRRAHLLPSTDGTLTARRDQPDDFEQFTSGLPRKPAGSNMDAPIRRRKP
jgi:hypothetical protein